MALTASFPTEDASGNPIDDTRRIFGGMVATAADGTPRLGVIDPDPSTPIVTGTSSMAYLVKGDVLFVTQRDSSTGGVELSVNDAVASIATTTAPVANSRIDVIWIKCQFDAYGDSGLYVPTFGVTQGTADASPSVPSIPTGATALAHAEVTSTDTTTETVVITQVAPFTAMAGGVVPVRNATELEAWEPADGALAYRIDNGLVYQRSAGSWAYWGERSGEAAGTASGSLPTSSGWIDLGGSVVIPADPFGDGVAYEIDATAFSTATITTGGGYGVRIRQNSSAFSFGGVAQNYQAAGQTVFRTAGRHLVSDPSSAVTVKAQIIALTNAATVDSANANLSGLFVTIRPRVAI